MKGNVTRGAGFRGALEYVCGKDESPDIVGGNMAGTTPRQLSAEFGVSRQLRPDIKKPVWHCSLALPAGETITADSWRDVAEDMLRGMDMAPENHQYVAVRHSDTEYDHIHIVASRVGLDGFVWHGKWEARRTIEATQNLEKKHGLTITPGMENKPDNKRLTRGELNKAARTGQEPPRQALRRILDAAAEGKPSAVEFAERVEVAGVEVRANLASTGKMSGFSFGYQGESYAASRVADRFRWGNLSKKVSYVEDRDSQSLERFKPGKTADPGNQDGSGATTRPELNQSADQPDQTDDRATDGGQPGSNKRDGAAPVVRGVGSDTDGVQQTDSRSGRPDQSGDGIHGDDQRSSEDRDTGSAHVDKRRNGAPGGAGEQRQPGRGNSQRIGREGQKTGSGRQHSRAQHGQVNGGGHGLVGLGSLAGDLRDLAERHVITPEKAREAIDKHIAQHPAPARPAGRKAPTGRLSRWFSWTKAKLTRFVEKARDYFNDATVMSADKGGWTPGEVRSAGLSGAILDRADKIQAELDAVAVRQKQEAQAAEAARAADKAQAQQEMKTEESPPEEPNVGIFYDDDNDESSGPSIS